MTKGFYLRVAGLEDAEHIAELNRASWQQNYGEIFPAEYLASLEVQMFLEKWVKNLSDESYKQKTWIAEIDGRSIGYCRAHIAEHFIKGYPGYIDQLHLLKAETGKGYGSKMFIHCRDYLFDELELEGCYLMTREKQAQAKKFYEKMNGTPLDLMCADRSAEKHGEETVYAVSYGWKK